MLTLWQHRECRFRELAELTSIEPPTLSRLLAAMTKLRLVKRRRSAADSRSIDVALTASGAALFARSMPFAENCNRIYLDGLAAGDLAVLRRALTKIYDNVERARAASVPRRIAKRRGTAA
jgi:DNA-binding MarR family transcriptional regulator